MKRLYSEVELLEGGYLKRTKRNVRTDNPKEALEIIAELRFFDNAFKVGETRTIRALAGSGDKKMLYEMDMTMKGPRMYIEDGKLVEEEFYFEGSDFKKKGKQKKKTQEKSCDKKKQNYKRKKKVKK